MLRDIISSLECMLHPYWRLMACVALLPLVMQCSNKAHYAPQSTVYYPSEHIVRDAQTQAVPEARVFESPLLALPASIAPVIHKARSYLGTPYRYGGNDYSGIDCSGLVLQSFLDVHPLPRASYQQANTGRAVALSDVRIGDVVFFITAGSRRINHAGVVTQVGETVAFIHASSSKGVIESSMDNPYWSARFVKARRYLD